MHKKYNPAEIESRWQRVWEEKGTFKAESRSKRPKYYCLEMLPYPSGRIHMGHVRNYTIGDAIARYKWMKGFNVLHPMGWDSFGMPAENAAIQKGIHPAEWTNENISYMRSQLKKMGLSYDWSREVSTCEPEYYRWEQLVFLKMYEKGLVCRKESGVNWCRQCQTVLANEQAEGGVCWRCDGPVEFRKMEQWFLRFPEYAEVLLKDIAELGDWPERVRVMQQEWIGRSEGALIKFPLEQSDQHLEVFTTRPDTLFGVTFMSLAWEHPVAIALSRGTNQEKGVDDFIKQSRGISREARLAGQFEKAGVFTGAYCLHPLTNERIPIYVANFVLMDYGTGAVMAVPAHDQRDFEFAKKYGIPIKIVIQPSGNALDPAKMEAAYEGEGVMANSGRFDGLQNIKGIHEVTRHLESKGLGKGTVTYKLKDWCISRQRYWGAPIPIIYCDKCGTIPDDQLPVVLPKDVSLTGEGGSPLAKLASFVNTKCPRCSGSARRETDTMDTFVESSWYFLRYCSPDYDKGMVDPAEAKYWMPIDYYIGGIEHAVGHLLYCRFFMKVLRDLDLLKFSPTNEPAKALLTQGMVIKDGAKMSKSKGNVVDPDDLINKYGADTARLFSLFAAPPERDLDWSDQGVEGMWRFLTRVWRIVGEWEEGEVGSDTLQRTMHKTIKRVTDDIERLHFNTAIAAIMEYLNFLQQASPTKEAIELLPLLLAPFAPHVAEEMWKMLGHAESVAKAPWPVADPKWLAEEEICIVIQVNGKVRDRITVPADLAEAEIKTRAMTEKVKSFIADKAVKNVVYVAGRLVNIVI